MACGKEGLRLGQVSAANVSRFPFAFLFAAVSMLVLLKNRKLRHENDTFPGMSPNELFRGARRWI